MAGEPPQACRDERVGNMSSAVWQTFGIALGAVLVYHLFRDRLDTIVPRV